MNGSRIALTNQRASHTFHTLVGVAPPTSISPTPVGFDSECACLSSQFAVADVIVLRQVLPQFAESESILNTLA